MPTPIFYVFALIMILGGLGVVTLKNPVSSALSMIVSFIGLAALLIGLNAYFVGILQVLVYAGAIMVLFLFIIMLLDLKKEETKTPSTANIVAGIVVPALVIAQLIAILQVSQFGDFEKITTESLATSEAQLPTDEVPKESAIRDNLKQGNLPDVNLIGQKLFTDYNLPLQITGVLLLVATVGCVALSKKLSKKSI